MIESWRIRPWRELSVLALIGMELSWLSLWFRILTQSGLFISFWRVFTILGGLWVAVYFLARALVVLRVRVSVQRGILGVVLVASMLFGLKALYFINQPTNLKDLLLNPVRALFDRQIVIAAELMVMLVLLWIWWRGIALVQMHIEASKTKNSFLAGVVALSCYGLFAPLTGEIPAVPLYLFLFFSLLGMSSARVYGISQLSNARAVPFDKKWFGGVLLSAAGLVTLAVVVVFLMQWRLADLIVFLAVWLWRLVFLVGMILMVPVMLLMMAAVPPLAKFLQAPVMAAVQTINQFLQEVRILAARLGQAIELVLMKWSIRLGVDIAILKPFLLIMLLVGLGAAVVWSLGVPQRWREQPDGNEERESIDQQGDGLNTLFSAFARGVQAMAGIVGGWVVVRQASRRLAAARVRRIYTALLELSEKLGYPRPPELTPLEYLPQLQALFTHHAVDLERITRAYLQVRYGETPETVQEVQEIETAWKSIQAVGKERLKKKTTSRER